MGESNPSGSEIRFRSGADSRAARRARVFSKWPGASRAVDLATRKPDMPSTPHVLVVRPDHLGDVLFLAPAVARLRAAWPESKITLMVGPWSRDIAERLPEVDAVTTIEFPWYDRRPKGPPWRPYVRLVQAARQLRRAGEYDAMFVMRDDDYWSAWVGALARVPVRVTHDHPLVRPFATHFCCGSVPGMPSSGHAVTGNVALVAAAVPNAGGATAAPDATTPTNDPLALASPGATTPTNDPLGFRATARDLKRARQLLQGTLNAAGRKPIAVHPGSGTHTKQWRLGAWASVIERLTMPDEPVVLTGGPHEAELTAALSSCVHRQVVDLAGRTDLGALAAVFAQCRLVLGPDSGPLHLAVAVGTPTVHLFGPADVTRFGPWGDSDRHAVVASSLPCAPCGRLEWPEVDDHPCVRTISTTDVVRAARSCGG